MPVFDPVQPFVLIDDARRTGRARLFTELAETVAAATPDQVLPAVAALRASRSPLAGFIGFEAGYALETSLARLTRAPGDGLPLLWFGRFARQQQLDGDGVAALLGDRRATVGAAMPVIAESEHAAMLAELAALIAAGDIYQANATFAATVATGGHPLAIYWQLRATQRAPHGALIHTGEAWILSFSPELFFTLGGGCLIARPMKGTAPRGGSLAADVAAAAALAADPKNRAENLMIVDLIRNDLARVAVPGSVAVPALFAVERYPTVLQMTSTVTAAAAPGVTPVDVLTALFPCGSVTGAPKIAAMAAIAAIEPGPRGLYTGSIGYIDGADASFNVAIRTLVMTAGTARIGLGSGIVADSEAASEWAECLAKAAFLKRIARPADLIETMYADSGGIRHLERHLARLAASAAYLGYAHDAAAVRAMLVQATAQLTAPRRLRLLHGASGACAVQSSPLPPSPGAPVPVAVVTLPVSAADWRLRHKTTDRGFYDDARRASGAFEAVFADPGGQLTEGSFTNVFVERGGRLLTPPLAAGLLPGVLRAALIDAGRAVEAVLGPDDLAGGFLIGNSLRGLLRARLVAPQQTGLATGGNAV